MNSQGCQHDFIKLDRNHSHFLIIDRAVKLNEFRMSLEYVLSHDEGIIIILFFFR